MHSNRCREPTYQSTWWSTIDMWQICENNFVRRLRCISKNFNCVGCSWLPIVGRVLLVAKAKEFLSPARSHPADVWCLPQRALLQVPDSGGRAVHAKKKSKYRSNTRRNGPQCAEFGTELESVRAVLLHWAAATAASPNVLYLAARPRSRTPKVLLGERAKPAPIWQ